jgi:hypothetical protein
MRHLTIDEVKLHSVYVVKHYDKGEFIILTKKKNEELVFGRIVMGEAITKVPSRVITKVMNDTVGFNPKFAKMKELDIKPSELCF